MRCHSAAFISVFAASVILASPVCALASCTWSLFTTPNVGTGTNILNGIAAASATSAIAVGSYTQTSGHPAALILRYGGTPATWKSLSFARPGVQSVLYGVSPYSSSGDYVAGYYLNSGSSTGSPLAAKLAGGTFTNLLAPAPTGAVSTVLQGVQSLSSTAAVFVGFFQPMAGPPQNYAIGWNGTTFVDLKAPNSSTVVSEFTGVSKVPGTSNIAVSGYHLDTDGDMVAFIYLYNTITGVWSTPTALDPTDYSQFFAVTAVSSTDILGAGLLHNSSTAYVPEIQKFNRSTSMFTFQMLPALTTNAQLNGIAARSATNALAVGTDFAPGATLLAEEWNGIKWTNQSPSLNAFFNGVAAVPTTTNYFAAGGNVGAGTKTLIEKGSCT